jgi:hypothetical protein
MRSNALKKHSHDYTQDNLPSESPEAVRARIAKQAEEAAHLPGNAEAPDFEEFALKYHITSTAFA